MCHREQGMQVTSATCADNLPDASARVRTGLERRYSQRALDSVRIYDAMLTPLQVVQTAATQNAVTFATRKTPPSSTQVGISHANSSRVSEYYRAFNAHKSSAQKVIPPRHPNVHSAASS
jgi:hypothetical protein